MSKIPAPEYKQYKSLEHWKPSATRLSAQELVIKNNPLFRFFSYIFDLAEEEYQKFPKRRDGSNPFLHPLNLVMDLKKAGIENHLTLSVALIHDLIEEKVDLYKRKNQIKEDASGIKELDEFENKQFLEFSQKIKSFCQKEKISSTYIKEMIDILHLLTRNKKDFYYKSIAAIYNYPNEKIKEQAIQIKLADRIHNIQTLSSYNDQDKIYQCFKNLFILNNTKKYLIEEKEKRNFVMKHASTEKLFKKCAKATYDAFLSITHSALSRGIEKSESMLQLAFKKYTWEKCGWWGITQIDIKETHPLRLYQGIANKYDVRLHQEWEMFEKLKQQEKEYCKKFFSDFKYNKEQLQAIIEYKDAYALKEIIARLIYKPNYILSGFACSELCTRKRKCYGCA